MSVKIKWVLDMLVVPQSTWNPLNIQSGVKEVLKAHVKKRELFVELLLLALVMHCQEAVLFSF